MINKKSQARLIFLVVIMFLLLAIFMFSVMIKAGYTDTSELTQNVNDCGILNTTDAVCYLSDSVNNSANNQNIYKYMLMLINIKYDNMLNQYIKIK